MINERKLAAIKKNAAVNKRTRAVNINKPWEFKDISYTSNRYATEEYQAKQLGYTKSLHWWWW